MLPSGAKTCLPPVEERLVRRQRALHLDGGPLVVQHREAVLQQQVVVRPPPVAVEHLGAPRVLVCAGREKPESAVALRVEIIPFFENK